MQINPFFTATDISNSCYTKRLFLFLCFSLHTTYKETCLLAYILACSFFCLFDMISKNDIRKFYVGLSKRFKLQLFKNHKELIDALLLYEKKQNRIQTGVSCEFGEVFKKSIYFVEHLGTIAPVKCYEEKTLLMWWLLAILREIMIFFRSHEQM